MGIPLDAHAQNIKLQITHGVALQESAMEEHQGALAECMQGITGTIRDLEMQVSHYKMRAQEYVAQANLETDLGARFRLVGAAVALQDAVMDLDRRIEQFKTYTQALSTLLDL